MRRAQSSKVDATVVVVTYNSARWIEACLRSLIGQRTRRAFEVVVVDHDSRDETLAIVRRRFPKVRVFQQSNRGFGAGCNRGAKEAKGDHLMFLNPDAIAEPGWLDGLREPLVAPRKITTSQIVLLEDPGRLNTLGHGVHVTGLGFVRGYRQPSVADVGTSPVAAFSGAAFAMRKSDFEALGGFDEAFFLYQDDTDLSWRAAAQEYEVLLCPASRARHHYAFRLSPEKLYHLERGRRMILRKHLGALHRLRIAPALLLTRIAVRLASLRFGIEGWRAVSRAAREARRASLARRPIGFPPLVSRRLPLDAMVVSRIGRLGIAFLNAVFRLNTLGFRRPWREPLLAKSTEGRP